LRKVAEGLRFDCGQCGSFTVFRDIHAVGCGCRTEESGIIVKAVTTARPTIPRRRCDVQYAYNVSSLWGGIVLNKAIAKSEQWRKHVPDDS